MAAEERSMNRLSTGQDKEDATGACTTICTYVASYFCSLKEESGVLEDVIVQMIVRGSIRWKEVIAPEWSSVQNAFMKTLQARMCIRYEQWNRPNAYEGRIVIDLRRSIESGRKKFKQPFAMFFCGLDHTYAFLLRRYREEIYFFDPHGTNGVFEKIKDVDDMIRVIHEFCGFTSKVDYEIVWAQHKHTMDQFRIKLN